MPATDLWPDFKIDPKPRGIRQMLEEAGQGLKEKTNDLVEFRVWPIEGLKPGLVSYRCQLRVEKLDYTFPLLEVNTSETGFPVVLLTGEGQFQAADETALLKVLETVFRSERTVAVIRNLISMATE